MTATRKPYLQYMHEGKAIIQIFHATEENQHCLPRVDFFKDDTFSKSRFYIPSFFFAIPVPVTPTYPTGIYHEFYFRTPMKCLSAAESAYDIFNGMPQSGGWK